jgi:hypothetical protein
MSTPLNRPLLGKLLSRVESPSAHEAVMALRMAGSQLSRAGRTWRAVSDLTRWMLDDDKLATLLETAAGPDDDKAVKALGKARSLLRRGPGIDFIQLGIWAPKIPGPDLPKKTKSNIRVRSAPRRSPAPPPYVDRAGQRWASRSEYDVASARQIAEILEMRAAMAKPKRLRIKAVDPRQLGLFG